MKKVLISLILLSLIVIAACTPKTETPFAPGNSPLKLKQIVQIVMNALQTLSMN